MTDKIPQGMSALIPYLSIDGAAKAIDLYKNALDAKQLHRLDCPQTGKVMHACLDISGTQVFLSDTFPEMSECSGEPTKASFYLYNEDVDAAFKKAKAAGMTEQSAPEDMFWGDRTGTLKDGFGNLWTIATHVKDVKPEDIGKAAKEWGGKKVA